LRSLYNNLTIKERLHPSRFIRGEKASNRPISLNHRHIFILPSAQGLFFAVTLSLMLIVSLNYNLSLGFALTFLLGTVSITSIFYCFQNLAGLNVQVKPVRPSFAGSTATINVQLVNHSQARWGVVLSKKGSKKQLTTRNIAAHETATLSFSIDGAGRGHHTVGTLTLSTLFPLGLFRAWSPINSAQDFLVYPKPSKTLIPFQYSPANQPEGNSSRKAGDEDFSGLTNYKIGDPIKRIDWKQMAKERGVFVRQFEENLTTELLLDWEKVPGPTAEEKLSQLCRQILEAEQNGFRYGLKLPSSFSPADSGTKHYESTLKQLALFQS
jgi:uncharacterized protein (DUF58 family)